MKKYCLTMSCPVLIHQALTRRLVPTISFIEVYLALLLEVMDREPGPAKFLEIGRSIPIVLP